MGGYDHKKIEKKWQKKWEKDGLYKTPDTSKGKDNFHLLVEFPYPSGNLHVGHWYAFAVPDILARHLRMQGKNVLYPIGFDAFGLPAENAAIKNKLNPRKWTLGNIEYMKKQIRSMGTSFDWSREVVTCDPSYYKWTQWLFLQLFKAGLVYRKETAVNWCPKDKTVLANEQVVDGKCERCDSEVVQKQMLQWNIKITDYAERLIGDLDALDWPKEIKESQKNWIGRSEGAEIDFPLTGAVKDDSRFLLLHGRESSSEGEYQPWLKAELEKRGYEVEVVDMPNPSEPDDEEQADHVEKHCTLDERTVVVGHSFGGVVAMRLLERGNKVRRVVFVATAVSGKFLDGKIRKSVTRACKKGFDFEKIKKQARTFMVVPDLTDKIIPISDAEALAKNLNAMYVPGKGNSPHFTGEKEPDVLMMCAPTIRVFTTRADTLFGGTYLVLAPEHPWVTLALDNKHNVLKNKEEVLTYVGKAKKKTEIERQAVEKEKTGVELKGVKAINPATGREIPVWVADFVLGHYGTGAVFADAHDERDFAFAKKYGIPLKETLEPLVVRTSGADTVRDGEPFMERNSAMAFVQHWSEDKYLTVKYKPVDVRGCVSGGMHEGEDAVAAAKREIAEETGYANAKLVRKLGGTIHSKYFSDNRKTNTFAHFTPMLFKLEDGTQVDVTPDEKSRHEVSWVSANEMTAFINHEDWRIAWTRVQSDACYAGRGVLFDSGEFDGLTSDEAIPKVGAKFGRLVKQYHLRDWIVSRQRYWGVPIPIIHCPKCGPIAVSDKELPVKLPEVKDYLPEGSGKSPLAKVKKFVQVKCPQCKGKAERETDTLDTFVDSSWYFLRYTDPKNSKQFAAGSKQKNWMPVDLYSGGAEHTTMHLLYSRFWHKALFDLGLVGEPEPYTRRMNRSLILGPDGQKMSKSRGNVIDPDEVVGRLGADTVRMYLAFIGPYNEVSSFPWNPDGVVGVRRFLERIARFQECVSDEDVPELEGILHRTIKKVGDDIRALKFNTAISQLMIFLNHAEKQRKASRTQWDGFIRLLAPFAPFLSEELWHDVGHKTSIHEARWPSYDAARLEEASITIAVQINGKTRGQASVAPGSDSMTHEAAATKAVQDRLSGKKIVRTVVVPGRLVNFVVEE
ncbi:class I tRNA ligase family protein [Candidatus Kaiserbacteria bacterium]|nr:class I tRNA ligase family protein [Candidatus Kaiserbacteria bacterium]